MISSTLVQYDVKPPVNKVLNGAAQALSSPVVFNVDCSSGNWLFLQLDIVKDTATNLAFKFENTGAGQFNAAGFYRKFRTDMGAGSFVDGTINLPTSGLAASDSIEVAVPLTGLGITSGNVRVTVTATTPGVSTIAIQPVLALVV